MEHPKVMFTVQSNLQKVWKQRRKQYPERRKKSCVERSGQPTVKFPRLQRFQKEKRPEVVAELRKPKAKRDSSITDSYSSPSKDNEFITTFKQDIQGHKKGLNKEEKQNLKDAVKSIYSPRRLADGEAMMCEIQGARRRIFRRWGNVLS